MTEFDIECEKDYSLVMASIWDAMWVSEGF